MNYHGYTTISTHLIDTDNINNFPQKLYTSYNQITNALSLNHSKALYFMTPITFLILLTNYARPELKDMVIQFLQSINYIVIWQEVLNPDFTITGYKPEYCNKDFILQFFKLSKFTISSVQQVIDILKEYQITNTLYHHIMGYSSICNITRLDSYMYSMKDIDILIYGSTSPNYEYRKYITQNIQQCKYCTFISDNIYGKSLDEYLKRTKIVLHIPSHPNLQHVPWAKISFLQAKGIFFLVERTKELEEKNLVDIIPTYEPNDVNNIIKQLDYYLSNQDIVNQYIEKNYQYSKENNIDNVIPNYIATVL